MSVDKTEKTDIIFFFFAQNLCACVKIITLKIGCFCIFIYFEFWYTPAVTRIYSLKLLKTYINLVILLHRKYNY